MDNGIYKKAVAIVTGLPVGFTDGWVVLENGDWRSLKVAELSVIEAKCREEFRIASVPASISRVQAMKAMKANNLWDAFKTTLQTNVDATEEWELSLELQRNHVFVVSMGPLLGLTEVELDDLFIFAATL